MEDESWPVRDHACVASAHFAKGSDGYPYGRKIYFVVGDRLVEGRRHAEPTTAKYRIDYKLLIAIVGLSLHDSGV